MQLFLIAIVFLFLQLMSCMDFFSIVKITPWEH